MKAYDIFTRKSWGLDIRVWLVMLALSFVSLGLIAWRFVDKTGEAPCVPLKITINGKVYDTGNETVNVVSDTFAVDEDLLLSTAPSSKSDITWKLSEKIYKEQGIYFNHRFPSEGRYNIVAATDNNCVSSIVVYVKKPAPAEGNLGDAISKLIKGNETALARTQQKYSIDSLYNFYEWTVIDNPYFKTQTTREAVFKFPTEGTYRILLTLDRDRNKQGYKVVVVSEPEKTYGLDNRPVPVRRIPGTAAVSAPQPDTAASTKPAAEPTKPVIIRTSNEVLKSLLIGVVNNKNTAEDFNKYLEYKGNTQVLKNGKSTTDFSQFCRDITGEGERKIRIESVEIVPENGDLNKILLIKVRYSRKNKIGIGWHTPR